MNTNEIIRGLRASGHNCEDFYFNGKGQECLEVNGIVMFHRDAEDLLRRRARLEEIIEKNKGKDLGWTYPVE